MARPKRNDAPGTWHHVMNRGLARRTLFESNSDIRMFLSRLAREVRAGRIEIHAYCVLTTHYHLLVRSITGELSGVMQHVQNEYSRRFNRSRRRDGPLVRGRFRSKRVRSEAYRRLLLRYIDDNPVSAGLVPSPDLYPHGSAHGYARSRGPVWLERSWVESVVRARLDQGAYDPATYVTTLGRGRSRNGFALVERRTELAVDGEDPLDELLDGAVGRVRSWMVRKAELADGTGIGVPVCDSESVRVVIDEARCTIGTWEVRAGKKAVDAWPIARVGLLRSLCGATLNEAGQRTGRTLGSAWVLDDRHRHLMRDVESYAERVAWLAREALVRCHGCAGAQRE